MAGKEDKCCIEVMGEMTMERSAAFSMLYYPLLGKDAAVLYHTLMAIATRSRKIKNHLLIEKISGLSAALIEKNRHVLEQFLLLKTYYKAEENRFVYQLFVPKNGNEFLRHEVFGRLYMKKMGKQVYEFNKLCFAHNVEDKSEYLEITAPFENLLDDDWKEKEEEAFRKSRPEEVGQYQSEFALRFNYDRFLQGLSKSVFPQMARNEKNLRCIGELATIHGIDEMSMRKLVSQSMNLKDNTLNLEVLKRKARNFQGEWKHEEKDLYSLPPVRFLQNLQRGITVSNTDKKLIESLLHEFQMQPEVVNVLIEYVLEKTNQKLTKSYVEKIAGEWIRLQIDTSQKAFEHIAYDKQKKVDKVTSKKLPDWYHNQDLVQSNDVEVDEEELQRLMKQLGGE